MRYAPAMPRDPLDDLLDLPAELEPVQRIERALIQAATGKVETVTTVDGPAGTVTTVKQHPPDVAAARAILTVLSPDRWRPDAAPVTAVQFVIAAPMPDATVEAWQARAAAMRSPALALHATPGEPPMALPATGGSVPDPLAVPTLPSRVGRQKKSVRPA